MPLILRKGLLYACSFAIAASLCASIAVKPDGVGRLQVTRARDTAGQAQGPVQIPWLDLRPLSHVGGYVSALAVDGKYAYVVVGPKLWIFDVSDPTRPVRVTGDTLFLGLNCTDMVVSGGYAFISGDGRPIWVVDVREPTAPHIVASAGIAASDLAHVGNYLYAVERGGYFGVLDISDPVAPRQVTVITLPGQIQRLVVEDSLAFVTRGDYGLYILDVSDPSSPREVSSLDSNDVSDFRYAESVAVAGDRVYVLAGNRDPVMYIIDVSKPSEPGYLGRVPVPDSAGAMDLALAPNVLLVRGMERVYVFDTSTPDRPTRIEATAFEMGYAHGIVVTGNQAYVAGGPGCCFATLDFAVPTSPRAIGYSPSYHDGLPVLRGTIGYMAAGSGLATIDVSDPKEPRELGFAPGPAGGRVALLDDLAIARFVGSNNQSGLRVFDISSPTRPSELGSVTLPKDPVDLAVDDRYAYVTTGGGLYVIDLSTPSAPRVVATVGLNNAGAIALSDGFAFVYTWDSRGFEVIDVRTPASPRVLQRVDLDTRVLRLFESRRYLYVVGSDGRLRILDIVDPTRPRQVASLFISGEAHWDIFVEGNYAYIAVDQVGIAVVDVSQPSAPLTIGVFRTPAPPGKVYATAGHLYLQAHGLLIMELVHGSRNAVSSIYLPDLRKRR